MTGLTCQMEDLKESAIQVSMDCFDWLQFCVISGALCQVSLTSYEPACVSPESLRCMKHHLQPASTNGFQRHKVSC